MTKANIRRNRPVILEIFALKRRSKEHFGSRMRVMRNNLPVFAKCGRFGAKFVRSGHEQMVQMSESVAEMTRIAGV